MMDMQKQGRYCRYHEAPQRRPGRRGLGAWLKSLAGSLWPREQEGRKRILPGAGQQEPGRGVARGQAPMR